MRQIFSPYRICPIGGHIDHQGGSVLGRTITIGTMLTFEPLDTPEVHLTSDQLGEANFRIGDLDTSHWARYAQAAARILECRHGMRAVLSGPLIGAGLSSSASVGLAYLKAFAEVNEIGLTNEQLVQLEYTLEHDELQLQIGLLDPMTIVHGQRNVLLFIETLIPSVTPILDPPSRGFAWIVAYTGVSRELARSRYNLRVEECMQAASMLKDGARILSDIPPELFEEKKSTLPENLRKRAAHYFSEVERVHQGVNAWREADLEYFGQLMDLSCASSISNYESGSDILIELHELTSSASGVYGSRFNGGGYGGCVVGLATRGMAENACQEIREKFATKHPDLPSRVFIAEPGDGLTTLPQIEGAGARP